MRQSITREERERIHAAIADIEQRTDADLDVLVTRICDRYSLYPIVCASFGALLVACIVALARPDVRVRDAMALQLALLIVLTLAFNWFPIRLALVPMTVKRSHARQLAHREFAAQCIAAGDEHARILFFVSTGERYVEIIADRYTHSLVSHETWDRIVEDFVTATKADQIASGLLAAIQTCGALLEAHHPKPANSPADAAGREI
jgi:putative membrane protein